MKKLLVALALGLLLVAALATVASADNGPHGGTFSATTDACANCHRVHSAVVGENALLVTETYAICMTCHDGSGAGTDVRDGMYVQAGADAYYKQGAGAVVEGTAGGPLMGGGFSFTLMDTSWNGSATYVAGALSSSATTSTHTVEGFDTTAANGTYAVWGSGPVQAGRGLGNDSITLECTSCHAPHGKAGWANAAGSTPTNAGLTNACDPANVGTYSCSVAVATYRILRWQPEGSNGFTSPGAVNWSGGAFPINAPTGSTVPTTGWTVPDNYNAAGVREWYTIGVSTAAGTVMKCGQSGTGDCGQSFGPGDYSAGNGAIVYEPTGHSYTAAGSNMAYFCAQCHDRYFNNSALRDDTEVSAYCGESGVYSAFGSAPTFSTALADTPDADNNTPWVHPTDPARCKPVTNAAGLLTKWGDLGDSGDGTYMFRHSSGDVRVPADGSSTTLSGTAYVTLKRSCMACHVAHGTSAAMTGNSGIADSPLTGPALDPAVDTVGGSLAGGSTLLRMDGRSICLRCHQTAVAPLGVTVP